MTRVRDVLGPVFEDEEFAGRFAAEGHGAVAPGLLALVCALQTMEDLTDRDAADAVRTRMDWQYALTFPVPCRRRLRLGRTACL